MRVLHDACDITRRTPSSAEGRTAARAKLPREPPRQELVPEGGVVGVLREEVLVDGRLDAAPRGLAHIGASPNAWALSGSDRNIRQASSATSSTATVAARSTPSFRMSADDTAPLRNGECGGGPYRITGWIVS